MKKLAGYQILKPVHKGNRSHIYKGIRLKDKQAVILKTTALEFPDAQNLNRLKRDFNIGSEIESKHITKYYEMEQYGNRLVIIEEDSNSISLGELICNEDIDIFRFIRIAIQLAEGLGEIHKKNIVHKNINLENIIIKSNKEFDEVKYIDFGISSHLRNEPSFVLSLDNIEGTLHYMSPEQTGRMNRNIDYRTDFYSLGVTFYVLLTGRLPFKNSDPLEVVYSHIAQQPVSPDKVKTSIPKSISDIIMKLLEKNAENRYQSAYGLRMDLEEVLKQIELNGKAGDFKVGGYDLPKIFQIPEKLYGREKEINQLMETFDKVSCGIEKSAMVLVSGCSGMGKSSLIHEIYKPLAKKNGYFISGKFDQFRRNIPYASIALAFQQLIQLILTESSEKISNWKKQILKAVGENGQVIIDIIPEVEILIGPQLPLPQLGAVENQNRFNHVFLNFSRVFLLKEQPLVIFLDNLQWADIPTFHMIELMLTDPDCQYLFFIGAYSNNEVDSSHPLMRILENIKKKKPVENIILKPLESEHVNSLLADSLYCTTEKVRTLGDIVYKKTSGNPFFLKMFLLALFQQEIISFDTRNGKWVWDIDRIKASEITDNVVDLMVGRIKMLPQSTGRILSYAALIGNKFDLKLLSIVDNVGLERIAELIWPALEQGLILPLNNKFNYLKHNWKSDPAAMFRFLHDRVQQAASSLLPEKEEKHMHLKIGRILSRNLNWRLAANHFENQEFALKLDAGSPPEALSTRSNKEDISENIFSIVDHLNKASSLITDKQEKHNLSQLNLSASIKAKLSSAYEPALFYINYGISLLSENSWHDNYKYTLSFYIERGEILYLNSKWDESLAVFNEAIKKASSLYDRCRINEYKVTLYRMKNDLKTALAVGIQALEELGISLKEFPDKTEVKKEIERINKLCDFKNTEQLYELSELQDPLKLSAMILLTACFAPAYFLGSRLINIIGIRMSEITIKYGNNPYSSIGYIFLSSVTLADDSNDFDKAYKVGRLALRLNEHKYHNKTNEALLLDMWGTFVCHHKEPLKKAKEHLMHGYYSGVENGSYQWAGYCSMIHLFMTFWGPGTINDVSESIIKILPGLEKIDPNMAQYYYAIKATIFNLEKKTENKTILSRKIWPNIDRALEESYKQHDWFSLLVYTTCRLSLANYFSDYEQAVHYAEKGLDYAAESPGGFINPVFHFHASLAFFIAYEVVDESEQKKYLKQIQSILSRFERYAEHCPENYLHQTLLIKAELERIGGKVMTAMDLYDQAIDSANDNGFIQNGAIANELASKFYFSINKNKIAMAYLLEAYYSYKKWGAKEKSVSLLNAHPDLLNITYKVETEQALNLAPLDINTVIKASQTISKEINLEKLLSTLMKIIIENAGAEKGFLVLEKDHELVIEAMIKKKSGDIFLPQSLGLEKCKELSQNIVQYVFRTGEKVLLNKASEEKMFDTDAYIIAKLPKSILCMPIFHKGKTTGVLYLENNLTTKVFTSQRMEVLSILTSQIAISIENARVHSQLEDLVEQRTVELQQEIGERRKAEETIRTSLEEKELLLREVHHRVKNNMQIISSLLSMQSDSLKDKDDVKLFKDAQNRIKAMSLIHEKVYQSKSLASVDFKDYVERLSNGMLRFHSMDMNKVNIEIQMQDIELGVDTAIPCGLIVNELISNSLKYAFPDDRKGKIKISMSKKWDGEMKLIVADNGISLPDKLDIRNTSTLGMQLIFGLAESQLQGKVTTNLNNGTEFSVVFKEVEPKKLN